MCCEGERIPPLSIGIGIAAEKQGQDRRGKVWYRAAINWVAVGHSL